MPQTPFMSPQHPTLLCAKPKATPWLHKHTPNANYMPLIQPINVDESIALLVQVL